MTYIQIVQLVIALLPQLIEAVKTVETALPQSGQGDQKLAIVCSVLESAWTATGQVKAAFDQAWPVLSATIAAIVSAFNAAGVFPTQKP